MSPKKRRPPIAHRFATRAVTRRGSRGTSPRTGRRRSDVALCWSASPRSSPSASARFFTGAPAHPARMWPRSRRIESHVRPPSRSCRPLRSRRRLRSNLRRRMSKPPLYRRTRPQKPPSPASVVRDPRLRIPEPRAWRRQASSLRACSTLATEISLGLARATRFPSAQRSRSRLRSGRGRRDRSR